VILQYLGKLLCYLKCLHTTEPVFLKMGNLQLLTYNPVPRHSVTARSCHNVTICSCQQVISSSIQFILCGKHVVPELVADQHVLFAS
jgi:hypothetical protein